MPVLNRIADFADEMKAWRHHLHRNPELGFECHQTAAFIAARLREQRAQALLFRQLTTVACDAPAPPLAGLQRSQPDGQMLDGLARVLRMGPMTRRRLFAAAGLPAPDSTPA